MLNVMFLMFELMVVLVLLIMIEWVVMVIDCRLDE